MPHKVEVTSFEFPPPPSPRPKLTYQKNKKRWVFSSGKDLFLGCLNTRILILKCFYILARKLLDPKSCSSSNVNVSYSDMLT